MVLGAPIAVSQQGILRFSLPAGHTLTGDNLHQLIAHRAEFIFIVEPDHRSEEVISEDTARRKANDGRLFRHRSLRPAHDIGQLWLYRFDPEAYRSVWDAALAHSIGIEEAERERFGTDHSTIGAWLGEHWSLTAPIVAAIRSHHAPDSASNENLVPLIHVAEVVSNALDLTGRSENRVTALSGAACRQLGVQFNDEIRPLFGRMEARSRYANSFFQ